VCGLLLQISTCPVHIRSAQRPQPQGALSGRACNAVPGWPLKKFARPHKYHNQHVSVPAHGAAAASVCECVCHACAHANVQRVRACECVGRAGCGVVESTSSQIEPGQAIQASQAKGAKLLRQELAGWPSSLPPHSCARGQAGRQAGRGARKCTGGQPRHDPPAHAGAGGEGRRGRRAHGRVDGGRGGSSSRLPRPPHNPAAAPTTPPPPPIPQCCTTRKQALSIGAHSPAACQGNVRGPARAQGGGGVVRGGGEGTHAAAVSASRAQPPARRWRGRRSSA